LYYFVIFKVIRLYLIKRDPVCISKRKYARILFYFDNVCKHLSKYLNRYFPQMSCYKLIYLNNAIDIA